MPKEFLLEIVKHNTGQIVGSVKGTAYYLSTQLQKILELIIEDEGVTITLR